MPQTWRPHWPVTADDAAEGRQQAAQQALERLRQANEDMRRATSQNASAADSRRAADRLREATDLLGRLQQQDARGRRPQLLDRFRTLRREQTSR